MGSIGAMKAGSADRYFQENDEAATRTPTSWCPRASRPRAPTRARWWRSSSRWPGGLRAPMGYCGCGTIAGHAQQGRVRRDHRGRHPRKPRPRRADHQGSAELPDGVSVADASGASAPSRRDREAAMPFIMLTVLIDMVAIGLIIPVLPLVVGQLHRHRRPSRPSGSAWCRSPSAWRPTSSLAGAGRAVRPLRPPAGAADRLLRPGAELLRHRPGHRAVDADRGAAVQRRDAGQRRGRQRLRGRHHRRRRTRAAASACWARCSASGFILGPAMAACWRHRPACRSSCRHAGGAKRLYGFFVLPESLPPDRATLRLAARQPVRALRGWRASRASGRWWG